MPRSYLSLYIDEIRDETPEAYTLFLKTEGSDVISYLPGQYLSLVLQPNGEEVRRAYSLSSTPALDDRLAITIKRVEGGLVSNYLRDELVQGDALKSLEPQGNFVVEPEVSRSRHYLMFAAGSGITPMMSIIKAVLEEEPLSRITLWYGNRVEESIIFKESLKALRAKHPGRLTVIHRLSQGTDGWTGLRGRVDKEYVYQEILELFMRDEYRKKYFICGPSAMMQEVYEALDIHAVHPSDIHMEYFTLPEVEEEEEVEESESLLPNKPELSNQKARIILDGQLHELEVKANQSLLDAAIEQQLDPPYACKAGLCISCKARKVTGEVFMNPMIGLTEEEMEEGYILSCQAFPLDGEVEIDYDA